MLEYILLGLLREQSMSGYDLKKTIDYTIKFFYSASFGSLYPALKRLENKNYVDVRNVEGSSKNKKIYSLTEEGHAAFINWLEQPIKSNRSEGLLKIFFLDALSKDKQTTLLQEFELNLKTEKMAIVNVEQVVLKELSQIPNPEDFYYRLSVLQYGIRFFDMQTKWLEHIMEKND
jgi:DNA-binding PadR family transcriptional regulator